VKPAVRTFATTLFEAARACGRKMRRGAKRKATKAARQAAKKEHDS
jgi:hypothetical protein